MSAQRFGADHKKYCDTWSRYPSPTVAETVITPPDSMMVCELETGGAMLLWLADADVYPVGTRILLTMKTDGGDVTMKQVGTLAFNATGNTLLTFAEAGDWIELVVIGIGSTNYWRIAANDGVALSTP